jgi:protein gp37
MSDLLANAVASSEVARVLDVVRDCPQHVFFILTKNARRLTEFSFPRNALVGVSSPPTFMFGRELSRRAQSTWFDKALMWLSACGAANTWVSLEPLSMDLSRIITRWRSSIRWAVIGAASNGPVNYQPDERVFRRTLDALKGIPVFFKGNIDRSLANRVAGQWRAEFPRLRNPRFAGHSATTAANLPTVVPGLAPWEKAWVTMRARYTPEEISARQSAAAKKAWATMRTRARQ